MANPIHFTKLSGSGNDFVFIDNRTGIVAPDQASGLAKAVCRHRLSVGADGIVLINPAPPDRTDVAYAWRYINADGSDGEMCGNASMCSARFALREAIAPAHHRFLTVSGPIEAWADPDSQAVSIAMVDTGPVDAPVSLHVEGRSLIGHPVLVGVPHVVILTDDADAFADAATFDTIGRAIRHDPAFTAGANVNVISPRADGAWRMRTYERGVERETLACGTGVVATSVVLAFLGKAKSPVRVVVSSGKTLRASFDLVEKRGVNVRLEGSATFVYDGVLDPEAIAEV